MALFPRLSLALLMISAFKESGQAQNQRPTVPVNSVPMAQAVRVEDAPKMDGGTLDDPAWQTATPIPDFRQKEPYEGRPATESTEVRILYTPSEIYFAIVCRSSVPRNVVATQLRRDVTQELDDYFEIIIDSRHDRRNAYVFQINPLGTQRDALITDEQQVSETQDGDPGWDGVWTSEARSTNEGWTATVGIPFSTLNFMRSQNVVWGINFKRFIRSKNEEDLWSSWRRSLGAYRISQAGELHGITDIGSGRLFIVKPYALGGFSHLPASTIASGLSPGTTPLYTGGLDIKVGLRSNLVANLTGNTDFADSDVDVQQFNLTPYKLFFPEKRQFFLENAGVFDFSLGGGIPDQLFFSRQIGIDPITGQEVPINGGAKITGSLGGFELGVMGVDKRSGNANDPFNQTGGVDGRLVLFKELVLHGYAVQTRTPALYGGQTDLGASMDFNSNWLELLAGHRKIGPNFNPEVGFVERTDCICDYVDTNFKFRPLRANLREVNFEGFLFHAPDTRGAVETQEWQTTFRAIFNNGSYTDDDIVDVFAQRLTTPFNIYRNVNIPVGVYNWTRHDFKYGSPEDRRFTVRLLERFGGYYDGHLNEARIRDTYSRSERLAFSVSPQWNRFRLPEGNFSVVFGAIETDYAFSRFVSLSTILQVYTANDQAMSGNIRLRWNYRPDSDLFVIYTAGQRFASLAATNPA